MQSTNTHRPNHKRKMKPRGRVIVAVMALLAAWLVYLAGQAIAGLFDAGKAETREAPAAQEQAQKTPEYIFRDGEGKPIDISAMLNAWAAEAGLARHYFLTDAERWEIASVITAEAQGEPFAGKVAVAQCILQACEDDGITPFEALTKYGYSRHRPEPSAEAMEAVQAVFDFGHMATAEPIKYFYAPARVVSEFHESQSYVMTINGHKFFKEAAEK